MRVALILVALVACGDSKAAPDADALTCKALLETHIERACTSPGDCVLVDSEDCCGVIKLGVNASAAASFPIVEAAFDSCLGCPPLGCAHQDEAEDGTSPHTGQTIVATCIASRCQSIVQ